LFHRGRVSRLPCSVTIVPLAPTLSLTTTTFKLGIHCETPFRATKQLTGIFHHTISSHQWLLFPHSCLWSTGTEVLYSNCYQCVVWIQTKIWKKIIQYRLSSSELKSLNIIIIINVKGENIYNVKTKINTISHLARGYMEFISPSTRSQDILITRYIKNIWKTVRKAVYITEKIILLFSPPYYCTIFAIFNFIFNSFVLMCVIKTC